MDSHTGHPHVLVGFDGTRASQRALCWAGDEAARLGVGVHVMACVGDPATLNPWYSIVPVNIEALREEIRRELDAVIAVQRAQHPAVCFTSEVAPGRPRDELIDASSRARLVVLGSAHYRDVARMVLGSVALSVAANAVCPVVLVPHLDPPEPRGRVVVGVDGSSGSTAALAWATEAAQRRNAELLVVHTLRPLHRAGVRSSEGLARARHDAAAALDAVVTSAREQTTVSVEGMLVEDRPAEALLRMASGSDLLVVGSKGRIVRTGRLGSVAHDVAARSPVPVVVVRSA